MSTKTRSDIHSTSHQPELAQLVLEGMGTLGDTIAHLDGEPVNVFGGIPGEEVMAEIFRYRRRRKHFVSGQVTEVLKASKGDIASFAVGKREELERVAAAAR